MTIPGNLVVGDRRARPAAAERLVVSETIAPADLRRLLESLIREDCVHSWRNFGPNGTVEELLQWENARRPTRLFFFQMKRGRSVQTIAAAAVADRLTSDFLYDGFPVLGRCCIMPEYRSQGFYRQVLQYRLDYCRAQYGAGLQAIHIGAVNDRIARVITNHGFPDWPRFVHMGEEALHVAGNVRTVGAYLQLMPEFVGRIEQSLAGDDAPPCVMDMRETLAHAQAEGTRNLGPRLKNDYDQARRLGWFDGREPREIEQLLYFCRAVPLVGFQQETA